MPSVTVTRLPNLSAHAPVHLLMTWEQAVIADDVREAFRIITDVLNKSHHPVFVVVDIRSKPRFPITQTISEAIEPYRHDNLAAWLVVGNNLLAKSIERVLATITHRRAVHWFDTLDAAVAFIEAQV